VRFWREQRESVRLSKDLVEPLSTSQLTNQQFINCVYLEILSFYVSCVSVVPEPCACTQYLYVPYKGHVIGTGQTETMEVSDSLNMSGPCVCVIEPTG
jgi:hypothetical protein